MTRTVSSLCFNQSVLVIMSGLVLREANSLFERPLLLKNGEVHEDNLVVPTNMDKMYLKLEGSGKEIVSLLNDNRCSITSKLHSSQISTKRKLSCILLSKEMVAMVEKFPRNPQSIY